MTRLRKTLAGCAIVLCANLAQAAVVQIQMSLASLNYNEATGEFCDSGGGIGCSAPAVPLTTMVFRVDGNPVGLFTNPPTSIGLNMLLNLPDGTPPTVNGTTAIVASAFDLFDAQINGLPGLFTNVTTGSITFSNNGDDATGTGFASIFSPQDLPFGLVASDPITWSFSSELGACTGAVGQRTCTYSGTAVLSWGAPTTVPEPSALLLLGAAMLAATALRRNRRLH